MVDSRFSLTNVQAKSPDGFGRVDDGRTCRDQVLQVVHERHALAQRVLDLLAVGDVRPGPDDLRRNAGIVTHDPESVLDPDVVPVPMPEPVLDGPSSLLDERSHLFEHPGSIVRMETFHPELWILEHLPLGEAHERLHVAANEGALIVA